jgi:hypothetical protein
VFLSSAVRWYIGTKMLSLLFSLFFSVTAMAGNLEAIDDYLGQPNWQGNFAKAQNTEIAFTEEGSGTSSRALYKVHSELTDGSTLRVSNFDEGGKEISSSNLVKTDWENAHGNWVRIFMAQTESYGYKMAVEEIKNVEAQVLVDGAVVNVKALQVHAVGKNQLGWAIDQNYVITNEVRGISQLLYREETQNVFGGKIRRAHKILSVQD